jgi:transcription elongation factor Elf1
MYNLLQVYDCPQCGERLSDQVGYTEAIDVEHDEVYPLMLCNTCYREVSPRFVEINGQRVPCYHEVDDERAAWANGAYDDPDEGEGEGEDYAFE